MHVYVWGTGCGAGDLVDTALPLEKITAFVDGQAQAAFFLGKPVIPPSALIGSEVDLLLVTTRDTDAVEAVCRAAGIGAEKCFFLKNHLELRDRNEGCAAAREVLGAAYVQTLQGTERLIRRPLWTEKELLPEDALKGDYVRLKTLELLCRELDTVPGAVAELGVYRGGFARCLNALLPDRLLYLFDTFEGFDAEESRGEGRGFVQAHRETGVERVLAALPHPDRARIRKGLFPATAAGLEERFALVSLDVDLEESTFRGLCWFLPRMNEGGFLLLHDYNSPKLPGVRAALRRYEREKGIRLRAVPLCDINGTLVISV